MQAHMRAALPLKAGDKPAAADSPAGLAVRSVVEEHEASTLDAPSTVEAKTEIVANAAGDFGAGIPYVTCVEPPKRAEAKPESAREPAAGFFSFLLQPFTHLFGMVFGFTTTELISENVVSCT